MLQEQRLASISGKFRKVVRCWRCCFARHRSRCCCLPVDFLWASHVVSGKFRKCLSTVSHVAKAATSHSVSGKFEKVCQVLFRKGLSSACIAVSSSLSHCCLFVVSHVAAAPTRLGLREVQKVFVKSLRCCLAIAVSLLSFCGFSCCKSSGKPFSLRKV